MGANKISLEDFKKQIDAFDDYFLQRLDSYCECLEWLDNARDSAKADADKYANDLINKNIKLYRDFKGTINEIMRSIRDTGVDLSTCAPRPNMSYPYVDDAIKALNDNIPALKQALDDANGYNFENSSLAFSFDNEKATINGQEYSAPNIPELSENDFDTDRGHVEKSVAIYNQCNVIDAICDNILYLMDTQGYKDYIHGRADEVRDKCVEDAEAEYGASIAELDAKCTEYYQNTVAPFLEANNNSLNSYLRLDNLEQSFDFPTYINIGSTPYVFKNYENAYSGIVESIDTKQLIHEDINLAFNLDLANKGNILINTNGTDENVVEFIHQLIMQFVASMPCKKLNLALVDADETDAFDFDYSYSKNYLLKNNLIVNGKVVADQNELTELITTLNDKLRSIKREKLGPKNCANVFDYNDISKENSQELYLLVYPNCPKCLNQNIADKISNLMHNGNACGVFTVILNNTTTKLSKDSYEYSESTHKEFIEKISDQSLVINYDTKTKKYSIDGEPFQPNYGFGEKDINAFFDKMNAFVEQSGNSNITTLESVIGTEYQKTPYYDKIKIPVGKDGGQPVFFELNVEGSGSSAIIAGGTGSGKSSFLHTIILSGAYNYSPDEIEYYLIDFKDGVEFSPYTDKNGGNYIPHVSFVSVKNKVEDAYDILLKIENEFHRRSEYFHKVGANDIKSYQSKPEVQSGKYPSFRRIIVIIDEYQNFLSSTDSNVSILCNKCAGKLTELLKLVRSHGISFVLSSQGISVEREALEQISNRYVFKSSGQVLQTAFPNFSGDELNIDLNKEVGLAYKTSNSGIAKQLFKAAYSGKTNEKDQHKIVDLINKKYPNEAHGLVVSGDNSPLSIFASDAPFAKQTDIVVEEDGSINAYFGQSAMSNELSTIKLTDSDFSSYVILGEMKKVRNIEASLGLSFLYALKKYDYDFGNNSLYYLDLNNSGDALRNPSLFDTYRDKLSGVMKYAVESEDIIASVNALYEEFMARKEASKHRSREIKVPRLLIINSFSFLSEINEEPSSDDNPFGGSSFGDDASNLEALTSLSTGFSSASSDDYSQISLVDKVKTLYANGYAYNIFVVIQERHASALKKDDNFANFSKVICCDKNETEFCTNSPTITDLPSSFAILYPNVSKVRPFEYSKSSDTGDLIDKLVEVLNQ